ncbi:CpaD family pilus assembly protein [Brevundimonas sp.]|uniref:CpaD family pilus assembly protein n=1 Tax=Brevundimonas sp. TaxID=1871086 RepID=UPI002D5002E0|nr:CpaD family pilus assembly protein [Brevundimonas sp.]HYD28557.1 CpaD family pilus assembly protein [Brevundimonas sp.]
MKRALLLAAAAATVLAGCASTGSPAGQPLTPLSRYSLRVEPGLDRIALAVHEDGLSSNQQAALNDLAGRYMASGVGQVRIEGPSGEDPAAARQTWAVRSALQAAGLPADRIVVASYAAPDPRAPVLAGFETVRAAIPNCAAEPRAMEGRFSNEASIGLGCAINANLAAQIADPRDIVGHRPISPADSGRAAVVFDNYRKGEVTAAPQEQLVEGRIARAVE